jgi:hypothetical protein
MIKTLWLLAAISAFMALALIPTLMKHRAMIIPVVIFTLVAYAGLIAIIILLFGGPFQL